MNLRDRAVDAPLRPHLAPVEDEFLFGLAQDFHISSISVTTENTETEESCQLVFAGGGLARFG
jgi:hypothetical protein